MQLSTVFNSITLIGMMIVIGIALARVTPINESTKKTYTLLIVNVAMPCIILSSIFKVNIDQSMLRNIGIVLILSVVINTIGIGIGWVFASSFSGNRRLRQEIALLSGLGNTGFIGIPLCAAILGPEGALYAAIFDAGVDIVIWTVGVMILKNSYAFSIVNIKSLINIPIVAIIVGLLCTFINYRPPEIFIDLSNQLAALASPLAMFYIGLLIMSKSENKSAIKTTNVNIFSPIFSKLVVLPIITLFIISILPIQMDVMINKVLLIQAMMPSLTLASILFTKYSKDEVFGAFATVMSTIISLVTIPSLILIFIKFKYM
ncbi:AEC family transporter [Sporosarcina aquimarina]|uniref:AEC family transporter n=1 Tax=Sporosarcina aquimarina TaxID=114975 RepID=UPI001C8CF96F|nr:AEC family transporter [Sporosarcina aquimarina]MBY0221768.1 AEC family transporter [Sporosarcina aquimarina]